MAHPWGNVAWEGGGVQVYGFQLREVALLESGPQQGDPERVRALAVGPTHSQRGNSILVFRVHPRVSCATIFLQVLLRFIRHLLVVIVPFPWVISLVKFDLSHLPQGESPLSLLSEERWLVVKVAL